MKVLKIKVYGRVQGVGYRFFTQRKARSLSIKGFVKNMEDGSVFIIAKGEEKNLNKFIEELKEGPPLAIIRKIDVEETQENIDFEDFEVKL